MPDNIAKKIELNLDTLSKKIIRVKDEVVTVGDSVELDVNIKEKGELKDLRSSTCTLIGLRSDQFYFEQKKNIVVNGSNIKTNIESLALALPGQVIFQLVIADEDEVIHTQKFILAVQSSIFSDKIIESEESITSIKKLNDLLDEYRNDLVRINTYVETTEEQINNLINDTENDMNELIGVLSNEINKAEEKLDILNEDLNTKVLRPIKLNKYDIVGSNYQYMATNVLNIKGSDLLKRAYDVFLSGVVQEGTHNSSLGKLTFYKQNNKVYPFFVSISDRSISSRTLSPSIVFDGLGSEIDLDRIGFRILVKSNLLKDLNKNDECICVFTPLGL